jgi:cold shock CspA family protein
MSTRNIGWLTNYNLEKGCGFIFDKNLRKSHFVHFTDIHSEEPISINDEVEFEVVSTTKGSKAVNVRKVI